MEIRRVVISTLLVLEILLILFGVGWAVPVEVSKGLRLEISPDDDFVGIGAEITLVNIGTEGLTVDEVMVTRPSGATDAIAESISMNAGGSEAYSYGNVGQVGSYTVTASFDSASLTEEFRRVQICNLNVGETVLELPECGNTLIQRALVVGESAFPTVESGDVLASGRVMGQAVQASQWFDLLPGEYGQEWTIGHAVIPETGGLTPDLCVSPGPETDCSLEIGPQVGEGATLLCLSDVASPNCLVQITPEGNMTINEDLMVERGLNVRGRLDAEDLTVYRRLTMKGDVEGRDAEFENLHLTRDLRVDGSKYFVQPHPTDPTKEIVYASLEGPEAGVYVRGEGRLQDGEAVIELPESFRLVASEEGLTVQLTPIGGWLKLYVVELTPERLVVREPDHSNARFYYLVQGIRKGYEGFEPIQDR